MRVQSSFAFLPRFIDVSPMTSRFLLILLFIVLSVVGCNNTKKNSGDLPKLETPPLSIGVVADEALAERIRLEVSARTEEKITVETIPRKVFLNQQRQTKDILIYPPAMMGDLIQRNWLTPIPSSILSLQDLALDDIVLGVRQTEMHWGEKTYALPLGSPVLMLMVRTDILKQLNLETPTTWQEYAAVVEAIHNSEFLKSNDTVGAATIEPFGEAYLPSLFLARSAAYVKHSENLSTYFDFTNGKSRLTSPGFVRAAEELAQAAQTTPGEFKTLDPQSAAEAFLAGKSVMAIGWLNSKTKVPETFPPDIAFAPLPGSAEIYQSQGNQWVPRSGNKPVSVPLLSTSGMVGSVTSASGQTMHAADLLVLLTGPELCSLISPASQRTTFYRTSSLPMAEAWLPKGLPGGALRQYAKISIDQLQSPNSMVNIRIAHRQEYEEALRTALLSLIGPNPPNAETALKQAGETWDTISEKQGQENQTNAYHNSQGTANSAF
ncbi:extracellular solute-binding protein [Bremerella cremea]|uniref:Extracellular solute-binding protein n=2 Tax=Bremerella cremea TaxID=1031537 RepID=A0A368KWY3_9BACT|nr:extracellular solute-binding protein [Bremerella cremea]